MTLLRDPSPSAPPGVWAPAVRRLTAGLVLTMTLVAFSSLAIATVMPAVEDDLGGLALYGWVFSGFFLASLLGTAVAGQAADRWGPARPFAAGLLLFAAGLVAGGLATSMGQLVAARVAQGLGAGAIPALSYAAVGRGYVPALRPRVFAVFSAAWVLPAVIGPAVSTAVVQAASWRVVFLGLLPLVALAAATALPQLHAFAPAHAGNDGAARRPSSRPSPTTGTARAQGQDAGSVPSSGGRTAVGPALVLVLGVAAVLAAGSVRPPVLAAVVGVAGAAAAVPAFVRLVPVGTLLLRPGPPATVAVRGLLTFTFFSTDAYVSLAVTEARGGGPLLAGLALSAAAIGWTGGAWVQARRLQVVGPRRCAVLGFAVLLAGTLGMAGVALGLPAWWSVPAWALGGLGTGLVYSPLSVTTLALAPPAQEGAASASLQLSDTLGVALGTGLGGALVAFGDGRGWPVASALALAFGASAAVAVAGLLASRRLPARLP